MQSFKTIIVDKDALFADLLARALHYYGMEMHWLRVDDAPSLLDILRMEAWDTLITRHPLECISANEIANILHNNGLQLPIIAVGDDVPEEDMVHLTEEGVHAVVTHGQYAWLKTVIEREMDRNRACLARRQVEENLKRAEETLALVTAIHPMGSWRWDTIANEFTWNFEGGVPLKSPLEREGISYERFLTMLHHDDRLPVAHAIQRSLEDIQDQSLVCFEFRLEVAPGDCRWLRCEGRVFRSSTGRPTCVKGVWVDCTDVKVASQERDALKIQVQKDVLMIKRLMGLLPVCPHCRKIRDKDGLWHSLAQYLERQPQIHASHGLCPDCASLLYPEVYR